MVPKRKESGYTLIELVVVVALIGIMLFFAVPRFRDTVLTDSTANTSRWIMIKVRSLKSAAVRDHKRYTLNVSLDLNRLWVTDAAMSEDECRQAEQDGFQLPDDVRILDVEFPLKGKVSSGRAEIDFYSADYSDKALIHIEDDRHRQLSFLIEPFLPGVRLHEKYIGFETG